MCGGLFEPLSRMATQIAMGPWFVRDPRQPFMPGLSYETLARKIQSGRIKPNSVLRGPTTRQFWALARHTPGVAHRLGYCHACGAHVDPNVSRCPACDARFQGEVGKRNELGLNYPSPAQLKAAKQKLQRERARELGQIVDEPAPGEAGEPATGVAATQHMAAPTTDLLDRVLGGSGGGPGESGPADGAEAGPGARGGRDDWGGSGGRPEPAQAPADDGIRSIAEQAEEVDAPRNPLQGVLIWVLLAINLIAIAAVVALVLQSGQAPGGAPGTGQAPPTEAPPAASTP